MVLQQGLNPQGRRDPDDGGPDPTRIIGISGTLAFNAVVLLVLLTPNGLPDTLHAVPERAPEFRWIEPPAIPPPLPPQVAEIVPPQVTAPRISPPAQTPPTPARLIDTGPPALSELPMRVDNAMADASAVATPSLTASEPLAGLQLRYASAPAPAYPRDALRRGIEGVVQLQVLVDVDGRPLEVRIHRSSGHRELDQAALRQVQRYWTFQPAMQDGRAVQATGIVPIAFNLDRG